MGAATGTVGNASDSIRFILDGRVVELDDVDPTRTVLQYLREDLRRTGTKEGCAEGDCGACTVVVAQLSRSGERILLRAVNSCIQFLPTLDGKELITVESLQRDGKLHPAQAAMVECHGSQCGFCTPGFIMSLYALYETNKEPSRQQIDDALAGNLCRCTGYRPIIAAARRMYELRPKPARHYNDDLLRALARKGGFTVADGERSFTAPATADELAEVLARHPDATLLAGGTDVGLWVTKQHRRLDRVVYTGRVAELNRMAVSDTHIEIGAAVPLTDAARVIVEHFPGLEEVFRRFASPPIRNAGTLGGNVANGSPIGDSMPALMVTGATLLLRRGRSQREVPLDRFYLDYQVNDLRRSEFIEAIRIPLPPDDAVVTSHKLSKRFDQDIAAVCNAYWLELDGDRVGTFRMACGGMAATVRRATNCEAAITGRTWDEETIAGAQEALAEDFQPITDMRASAEYRRRAAGNLLRRFFLETNGEIDETVYTYGRED